MEMLNSNYIYGSDNIYLSDESSNIIYPMNNEDFLRNNIECIPRTNPSTKDTSIKKITNDNFNKAIQDIFVNNGIELIEREEEEMEYNNIITSICNKNKKVKNKLRPGRKIEKNVKRKYKRNIHTRNEIDNIRTKLQVHFMNFILNISNDAIKQYLKKSKKLYFKHIDYQLKKNINSTFFEKLKNLPIKEILQMQISSKYKNYSKIENYNKIIYNNVINVSKKVNKSDWFNDFFEMKYLTLFQKYYNNNEKLIKLNFKGKDIILSKKTKSFNDLIKSNLDLEDNLIQVCKDFYFYFRVDKLKKIK